MATCPRCHDFLGPGHRCKNLWRIRIRRVGASLLAMFIGMTVGVIGAYAFVDPPSTDLVLVAALAGLVLGQAVWTAAHD